MPMDEIFTAYQNASYAYGMADAAGYNIDEIEEYLSYLADLIDHIASLEK